MAISGRKPIPLITQEHSVKSLQDRSSSRELPWPSGDLGRPSELDRPKRSSPGIAASHRRLRTPSSTFYASYGLVKCPQIRHVGCSASSKRCHIDWSQGRTSSRHSRLVSVKIRLSLLLDPPEVEALHPHMILTLPLDFLHLEEDPRQRTTSQVSKRHLKRLERIPAIIQHPGRASRCNEQLQQCRWTCCFGAMDLALIREYDFGSDQPTS